MTALGGERLKQWIVPLALAMLIALLSWLLQEAAAGALQIVLGWANEERQASPHRTLQVPLAAWCLVAAYVYAYRRGEGVSTVLWSVFLLSASLHLFWAAGKTLHLLLSTASPLAGLYRFYGIASLTLVRTAIGLAAGIAARRWHASRGRPVGWVVYLPVAWAIGIDAASDVAAGAFWIGLPPVAATSLGWQLGDRWARFGHRLSCLLRPGFRWLPSALLLLVVMERLAFGLYVLNVQGTAFPLASDDGPQYDSIAWQLASGDPLQIVSGSKFFNLYPAFLTLIYVLSGHSYGMVVLVQSLLAAATGAAILYLGSAVVGRGAALAGLGLFAVHTTAVGFSATLTSEALYIPAVFVAFAVLLRLIRARQDEPRSVFLAGAIAGVAIGIAMAAKDIFLPFIPLLVTWVLWRCALRERLARGLGLAASVVVLALVVYVPYAVVADRGSWQRQETVGYLLLSQSHSELAQLGVTAASTYGEVALAVLSQPDAVLAVLPQKVVREIDFLFFTTPFNLSFR